MIDGPCNSPESPAGWIFLLTVVLAVARQLTLLLRETGLWFLRRLGKDSDREPPTL